MVGHKMGVAVVMAAMTAAKAAQSYKENRSMAQAAKAETEANVANLQQTYKVKKEQLTRQQEQFAGKQTVAAAGSGATLNSFDSLNNDSSQASIMDQALLEYDKNLNISNTVYQGQMKKKQYYQAARSTLLSGMAQAATSYATSGAGSAGSSAGGLYGGGSSTYSNGQTINWYAK